jgi:hypothetical protein
MRNKKKVVSSKRTVKNQIFSKKSVLTPYLRNKRKSYRKMMPKKNRKRKMLRKLKLIYLKTSMMIGI